VSRRAAKVTQADIARAIRAVEQTGGRMAIEITPDGIIRLTPVSAAAAPAEPRNGHLEPEREIVL
jgi:hypothetical protein